MSTHPPADHGPPSPIPSQPLPLPPPVPRDPAYVAPPRDPAQPGPRIVAEITPIEGQVKAGAVQGFAVRCDEGATALLHGTGTAPSPLGYFTLAIGF